MQEIHLDERKAVLLGIMVYIDSFCQENQLKYYLTGGSLLGAVRHHGFIPWDDDMDIAMPRKDYLVFLKTFVDRENRFKLLTYKNTKGYYLAYAKVCDTRTSLYEDISSPIDLGVNIDIFPLDFVSDNLVLAKKLNKKIGWYRRINNYKFVPYRSDMSLLKKAAFLLLQAIPRPFILKRIDSLSQTYDDRHSKYCAIICMMTYGEKEIMESCYFEDIVRLQFEKYLFNCPKNYDKVLRNFYGEYMCLPPKEKRVTHHSNRAYWR